MIIYGEKGQMRMSKNSNAVMSSIVTISWFIYTVYQNYPIQFTVLERYSTEAKFYIKKNTSGLISPLPSFNKKRSRVHKY